MATRRVWTADDIEEIYSLHYKYAVRTCRRYGADDNAEDLAQKAFMLLWDALKRGLFQGDAEVSSYLFKICRNEALQCFRARARHAELNAQSLVAVDAARRTMSNGGYARLLVAQLLKAMPPGYRQALLLREHMGYEHDEIAALTGKNAGTSKSQAHKAKEFARAFLHAL